MNGILTAAGAPAPGRASDLVLAAFVAVLLISNVASTKILVLGPFSFDGGTILFPLSYIFGDVLTEVYGFRRARRVIWIGFAATPLTYLIVNRLKSAEGLDVYDRRVSYNPFRLGEQA